MARFYASIQGDRGEATRKGNTKSGLAGNIRGWNVGARVLMSADENDEDVCTVYLTAGSNGKRGSVCIGRFKVEDLDRLEKEQELMKRMTAKR